MEQITLRPEATFVAQVGGNHYAGDFQHWDFIEVNGFGYLEGCSSKYLTRWREKGGVVDLRKSLSYADKTRKMYLAGLKSPRFDPSRELVMPFASFFALDKHMCSVTRMAFRQVLTWRNEQDLLDALSSIRTLLWAAEAEL
jgi:hypothetical protein